MKTIQYRLQDGIATITFDELLGEHEPEKTGGVNANLWTGLAPLFFTDVADLIWYQLPVLAAYFLLMAWVTPTRYLPIVSSAVGAALERGGEDLAAGHVALAVGVDPRAALDAQRDVGAVGLDADLARPRQPLDELALETA